MKTIIAILAYLSFSTIIVAQTSSLTASYLHIDAGSDGILKYIAKETGEPSYGDELDKAPGLSIEWRTAPIDGISFGLEYIYFDTGASVSGDADSDDANDLNSFFDGFQEGASEFKEEYTTHTFLLNVAYDVEICGKLAAYLGAGLGFSYLNQELSVSNPGLNGSLDDSDTVFAYQLKAGLRYAINEAWSVQGGVRYLDYDDFEFSYEGITLLGDGDATAFEFGVSYAY
jgi:opacity protein-like surface antigen